MTPPTSFEPTSFEPTSFEPTFFDPTSFAQESAAMSRWREAVDHGARGWYSAARAAARELHHAADPVVRSLSWSLEGSLERQLGGHAAASVCDGVALADSGFGRVRLDPRRTDAAVDALVGLAADSIGSRRLSRSGVLLRRAEAVLAGREGHARVALRVLWVRAEVNMARGDAETALAAAEAAVDTSYAVASERHRIKSRVILSAARLVAGERIAAAAEAQSARSDAEALDLLPLAWAAASISEALGETGAKLARESHEVAIRTRGGRFS
ncbi:MAG: hypothetical protein WBA00_09275 [Rhodococcus sp. (in: high G+C Gram-positive bacteria)]